jgi:outer membrane protein
MILFRRPLIMAIGALAVILPMVSGPTWAAAQSATPQTPQAPVLTFDQAIATAIAHNPQVAAAQQALAAAQQGVTVARAGFWPTVSVAGNGAYGTASATTITPSGVAQVLPSPQGTGSVSLIGTIPVFDMGKTAAEVASAQAAVAIAQASLRQTQQDIALQTATAYLSVLGSERLTAVRQAQLKLAQDQLAMVQAQVKAGVAAQADIIQAQAQVAQAQVNLLTAQAQISTNKASLQALLGADVVAPIEVQQPPTPTPSVTITADTVLQRAMANRPEIAVAQGGLQSAQAGLTLARITAGPQVSIDFNTAYTPFSTSAALGNSMSYGLGSTVSLPLFDAGKGKAEVAQAQATLAQAQATLASAQLSVRQDAYQAYLGAVQAAANVPATQTAAAAADEALAAAQGQYRAGVGTIVAVTTAEANAAQAEANAVTAVYSYETALATLLHAEGMPIQAGALQGGT